MSSLLYEKDADLSFLNGKTVAVMGYGAQGCAQAQCLRDSGVSVIIGLRKDGKTFKKATEDGFAVYGFEEAAKKSDIKMMLLPDEVQGEIYKKHIEKNMKKGDVLSFAHGFNIVYGEIKPSKDVDVILVAPKGPGTEVRRIFQEGFGIPGLFSIGQNATGNAKNIALAIAKGVGLTRAGVMECTFKEETNEDLFGEQNVLCGGLVDLMVAGFEVLTDAGYPPEMAYFECVHEVKLIVDLVYSGGIARMNEVISNTAEWGEYVNGPKILPKEELKAKMRESLKFIESGNFAKEWLAEYRSGSKKLNAKRNELDNHLISKTGNKIRSMFEFK